jgi:hypothetical protein
MASFARSVTGGICFGHFATNSKQKILEKMGFFAK